MTPAKQKPCKDCVAEFAAALKLHTQKRQQEVGNRIDLLWDSLNLAPKLPRRPAPHPGPRCASHWRKVRKAARERSHDRKVVTVYGLKEGEYKKLYVFQGSKCAICRRATGKAKRLAVDHDHVTGDPRGLLCGPCNQMLGHAHDSVHFFVRAIQYLQMPPYLRMNMGMTQLRYVVPEAVNSYQTIYVHESFDCEPPCAIHAPSDHVMKDFTLVWRSDARIMERQCPHGIGHPDPDDIAYRRRHGQDDPGIHGCDGCCTASGQIAQTAEEIGLEY